jgi:pyrrolidone-carboxylate peptidase
MRSVLRIITCVSISVLAQNAHAGLQLTTLTSPAIPSQVLVTYFDPFNAAKENNSKAVAESLRARLMRKNAGMDVALCRIPTVYARATSSAQACVSALSRPPSLVISLGEGFCTTQVETQATNRDSDTDADNAGETRLGQTIVPDGPAILRFNLPVLQMVSAMNQSSRSVQAEVSSDMQNFLCNHLGYELGLALQKGSHPETPFGFIHVPSHECSVGEKDPEAVAKMIEAGLGISSIPGYDDAKSAGRPDSNSAAAVAN